MALPPAVKATLRRPKPFTSVEIVRGLDINDIISSAQSLPDLLAKLEEIDPALADQLRGKALVDARTPWGILAAYIAAWAISHFGLHWDADTTTFVSGLAVFAGSYIMRYITGVPIDTVMPRKPKVPLAPTPNTLP